MAGQGGFSNSWQVTGSPLRRHQDHHAISPGERGDEGPSRMPDPSSAALTAVTGADFQADRADLRRVWKPADHMTPSAAGPQWWCTVSD